MTEMNSSIVRIEVISSLSDKQSTQSPVIESKALCRVCTYYQRGCMWPDQCGEPDGRVREGRRGA
jgi:hypothetical protein